MGDLRDNHPELFDKEEKPTEYKEPTREQYEDAMNGWHECLIAEAKEQERKSILIAIKKWCKDEDNYSLNPIEKIFYTIKYLLCLLFKLRPQKKHKQEYDLYDDVIVCIVDERDLYAGWEATFCRVGYGVFKNWFYHLEDDGDWNM